ncbi:MAG: glycosyltransferase family 9 protein [bacterium]
MTRTREICLIQLARFGDLIQTSPFLQLLREQEPDARISMFTDSRVVDAGRLLDGVDDVFGIDLAGVLKRLTGNLVTDYKNLNGWAKTWQQNLVYDRLILLNHGTIPAAISTFFTTILREGPMHGTAFDRPHRFLQAVLADRWYNPIHLSEIWAAYAPPGFPVPVPRLTSKKSGTSFAFLTTGRLTKGNKNKIFAANLGAGAAGRRMSKENLADLVRYLLKNTNGQVVLVGLKEDMDKALQIVQAIPDNDRNRIIDLSGKTTLSELAEVLKAVDVLISTDTGTLQLSSATGTKSVGLFFSGTNPLESGAYSPNAVAVVRRDSPIPGLLPSRDDMILAAKIAIHMIENQSLEDLGDENDACTVLVARSAPVGVEYSPLRPGRMEPVGKGRRWLPLLRHLLWGGEQAGGTIQENTNASTDVFDDDDILRLKKLLEEIMQNQGKQLDSWDEETRWLAHVIAAFPTETARWIASGTEKHAGRIYA